MIGSVECSCRSVSAVWKEAHILSALVSSEAESEGQNDGDGRTIGMDFFASDIFLTALARDYHRASTYAFKTYALEGQQVRLVEIDGGRPVTDGPFYDYVKPLPAEVPAQDPAGSPSQGTVSYLPRLVTSVIALQDRDPESSLPLFAQEPAPLIVWERFSTWEDYLALLSGRSRNLLAAQRKKLRRMTDAFGDPVFTFDDRDPAALDSCIGWKIGQYEGGHETLEDPRALLMLKALYRDGHLVVSTLRLEGRCVAVHAGFVWEDDYLDVLSAYDPAVAVYGVGRELRMRLLEHSYRLGHRSFDLLLGTESYKWYYATHLQLVESYGTPPLARRVRDTAQRAVKQRLMALSPQLFYRAKKLVIAGRRQVRGRAGSLPPNRV